MITNESMKKFCEENPKLVMVKETSNPELFVLKYRKCVFYDNLWNDFLEECRGTIVDKNFNPVSIPLTKIYNDFEDKAPKIDPLAGITAYRKINGFMGAITYHNGELLISTTGSIDSDFVGYIRDSIDYDRYLEVCKLYPSYTFIFECVHEKDPHIIPEESGMYLLAYREKDWGSQVYHDRNQLLLLSYDFDCFTPAVRTTCLELLLEETKIVKHEGFVWYDEFGNSGKIKSPYYLATKALARKADIMKLNKQIIDEEYYELIDHIKSNKHKWNLLDEQERLCYIRNYYAEQ